MVYEAMSVREMMNLVNQKWFLPATQRPYVWGDRYRSERYVCKLFDSLLRRYPIGIFLIWYTKEKVPYRKFLAKWDESLTQDKSLVEIVEEGLWGREDKGLVYDGQQRIQTIYLCLEGTFNGKVLVYDLTFDINGNLPDEEEKTGFKLMEPDSVELPYLKMTELFAQSPGLDKKYEFKEKILNDCKQKVANIKNKEILIQKNIEMLWDIFVENGSQSIAVFKIQQQNEEHVNEIFQRINSTGVTLAQADLLLSKIKVRYPKFEEELYSVSNEIFNLTNRGYWFDVTNSLQLITLILKKTIKIDLERIDPDEYAEFVKVWYELVPPNDKPSPLKDFFEKFLYGEFKINNKEIITKEIIIYPLIIYMYKLYNKGMKFRDLRADDLIKMKKYLILAYFNDWNLPTLINNFSKKIMEHPENDFPLSKIEEIARGRREVDLIESSINYNSWFALKIFTPNREYKFKDEQTQNRFNPQIDHIFPIQLEGHENDSNYKETADKVWNLQPVEFDANNSKSNKHPKDFFSTDEGRKYLDKYDYVPKDLSDNVWDSWPSFILRRRNEMIKFLKTNYDLDLKEESQIYLNCSKGLKNLGNLDEAIRVLDEGIRKCQDNCYIDDLYLAKTRLLVELDRYEDALQEIEKAISEAQAGNSNNYPQCLAERLILLSITGKDEELFEALQKAKEKGITIKNDETVREILPEKHLKLFEEHGILIS